jgi:hypothetical protein
MRRIGFVLVAVAVVSFAFLGGCGARKDSAGGGDAKKTAAKALTPKETVDAFYESFTADGKKWETAIPLMTKGAAEFFELSWKAAPREKGAPNFLSYTVGEEKIDGEKATVKFKGREKLENGEEKDKEETITLRKEDGVWKIYGSVGANFEDEKMLNEMRKAVKAMEAKKN